MCHLKYIGRFDGWKGGGVLGASYIYPCKIWHFTTMMTCAHHTTMQNTHSASSSEVRYCRLWPWVELGCLQMLEKWAKSAAVSDIIIKLQKQPAGGFENILKISQDCSYHFLSHKTTAASFFQLRTSADDGKHHLHSSPSRCHQHSINPSFYYFPWMFLEN